MEVDRFFNGYGRMTLILMRKRHSFVFIHERQDAEEAVKELQGRKIRGGNVILELLERNVKCEVAEYPRYRLKVENISHNTASAELRDYMQQVSPVQCPNPSVTPISRLERSLSAWPTPAGSGGRGWLSLSGGETSNGPWTISTTQSSVGET